MFGFAMAGCLYVGCSERNNVAREGGDGLAGEGPAGAGSSTAGTPSSAGSDGAEGGSGATGVGAAAGAEMADAGEASGGMAGAGGDGGVMERPPAILVVGTGFGTSQGTSYVNGVWAPVKVLTAAPPMGGVMAAVLADGTGIAASTGPMGESPDFLSAAWDGQWVAPSLVPAPKPVVGGAILSRMATFPGGALVAHTRAQMLGLSTYDAASETWTLNEDLGVADAFHPAVAQVGPGDPLVVYYANGKYSSRRKMGDVWAPPIDVPITGEVLIDDPPQWEGFDGVNADIDLVRRVGTDEIVGVFANDFDGLDYSVYSNGTWSQGVRIATAYIRGLNISASLPPLVRHTSMAALPDGRVALAYWAGKIKIGFFDGSSWSEFKEVPYAEMQGYSPIAISRGAPGAVLELLFTPNPASDGSAPTGMPCAAVNSADPSYCLKHTRLTNEQDWTWTPHQVVDANHKWVNISIAATP